MSKKILVLIILFATMFTSVLANEGMWIPLLLKKYNIADMQQKGFKLTAEDIYSVNKASMKDAVLIFGGGCTGEVISDNGLIITNHHCGYSQIQAHSSLENDYLTDGYWAMSKKEELINEGLTVTFLIRMEDVTERIQKHLTNNMMEAKRQNIIDSVSLAIKNEAIDSTHYSASVVPFYYGNEFYLFVKETFKDVRYVGSPPSAIGKFGGDTDNWMWPRHTGDFSVFRIYADKDNKPSDYSSDNIPYKPKKHFPISLKGIKKGDFTLVPGYPGTTQEYLTSYAVKMITQVENPHQIKIRQAKINIMKEDMENSKEVRIKYSKKYARVSNYWKKWIGENKGLRKLNAIEKKQQFEEKFIKWINSDPELNEKYKNLLPTFEKIYEEITPYNLANDYFYEAFYSLSLIKFATKFSPLAYVNASISEDKLQQNIENTKASAKSFFKDYNKPTDKKLFAAMVKLYFNNLDTIYHPAVLKEITHTFQGNTEMFAEYFFSSSIITDENRLMNFLDGYTADSAIVLQNDPIFVFYSSIISYYFNKISLLKNKYNKEIDSLNRVYVQAQRDMQSDKLFYPDANSTFRVTYGIIDDYEPNDATEYDYYTTLEGIIEKDNPEIYDYKVPTKLKELYTSKDYGDYGEDGKMHVCFTASNHTTGGNSGSPVINGDGHLIGINFDRNWEGTMSDIMYDPDQCRNISVDIRYVLFIIDKFAGAKHLIEEMTIIY